MIKSNLLASVAFFMELLLLVPQPAHAATNINIKVGGLRNLELSRPADKIVNHNPELIRVTSHGGKKTLQVQGIKAGEGSLEAISHGENGKIFSRTYSVTVRDQRSNNQRGHNTKENKNDSVDTLNGAKKWVSQNFESLKAEILGQHLILGGSLKSTEEFWKLKELAEISELQFIPQYSINPSLLQDIVTRFNAGRAAGNPAGFWLREIGNVLILEGSDTQRETFQQMVQLLRRVLPHFDARSSVLGMPETQVKVTFHIVESTRSKQSESGQKISGVQYPIEGTLTLAGPRQAPFRYYLKYLNEHMATKILDQPELLSVSGQEGELHSGGDLGYQVALNENQVETRFRPYGLLAAVKPTTRLDGTIALELKLELSEPTGTATSQAAPALNTRKIKTNVTLEDGMAQLIARITRSRQDSSVSAPPILEDIPLVSWLFSSNSSLQATAQLWVFVSATSSLYQDFEGSAVVLQQIMKEHQDVPHR